MRILHVLDHSIPLHSGYSFRSLAIFREQRKRGWQTLHLTGPKHNAYSGPVEEVDGLQFFRTAPMPDRSIAPQLLGLIDVMSALTRRLDEVVRAEKPDIIHAHSPVLDALPAIRVGRRHRIPVVYEVRAFWEDAAVDLFGTKEGGTRYKLTRALETYALRRADAVTTICEGLRADIVARGIKPERVTVIPNAVDAEMFPPDAAPDPALQAKLGLPGKKVLAFIGSFYAYEGLEMLLDALPEVVSARPDVRVLLVGGGPREAALKEKARVLELESFVLFSGRVPHQDVDAYYALADVLVYPRMPMRLTEIVTPLKPLEAMARKRVVIASDVGGHRELIRDGETGLLFKAGSVQSLTKVLLGHLSQPDQVRRLTDNGRRFVEAERTWTRSVGHYEQVYGGLRAKT